MTLSTTVAVIGVFLALVGLAVVIAVTLVRPGGVAARGAPAAGASRFARHAAPPVGRGGLGAPDHAPSATGERYGRDSGRTSGTTTSPAERSPRSAPR